MVRHIVFWRLKGDTAEEKSALALEIKTKLEALNGHILGMRRLEVGLDFSQSAESADLALYSEFESRQALDAYQVHPEHVAVIPLIKSARLERRVVDYET